MTLPVALFGTALVAALAALTRVPLRYNARNLSVRWKTTLITALAFTLVIGLMTVMLAFVNGMTRLTEASGHAENVIVLADGATDEVFSNLTPTDIGDLENQRGVLRAGPRPMASRELYLVAAQPIPNPAAGRPKRRFLQIRGIDDPSVAAAVHRVDLFPGGRWFAPAGVQAARDARGQIVPGQSQIEVVVGEGIAREMGRDRSPSERVAARNPERLDVGDVFQLDERPWRIVGVMQSGGLTFDSEVWAKRSVVAPIFGKQSYTSLVIRTADAPTARQLKTFFGTQYKKAAVQAAVETDYYNKLSETSRQFAYAVGFVTVVMSIGGVFGVMNTMFAAISQRGKDIGVLRLLGFKRWEILVSFLFESLMIALVGGALGCLLGSLCDGWSATSVVASGPGGGKSVVLKLAVDSGILAQGLLLALAMGFLGGLLPALVAMKTKPLDALR